MHKLVGGLLGIFVLGTAAVAADGSRTPEQLNELETQMAPKVQALAKQLDQPSFEALCVSHFFQIKDKNGTFPAVGILSIDQDVQEHPAGEVDAHRQVILRGYVVDSTGELKSGGDINSGALQFVKKMTVERKQVEKLLSSDTWIAYVADEAQHPEEDLVLSFSRVTDGEGSVGKVKGRMMHTGVSTSPVFSFECQKFDVKE